MENLTLESLSELVTSNGSAVSFWFLTATALVFFMQCGFAAVESGFTRAKNAGNIIMKNLMDFCVGTVAFILMGYSLLCGASSNGLFGMPSWNIFSDYAHFDWAGFCFNLVFCATAATIVSGAMAERTKFSSYMIYSFFISLLIYPVEAHWVWNAEGWLAVRGFHDFAGSAAIHMVGGCCALIGAALLGPRLGKYTKDAKSGKTKVHAIPGHSITLGALGVFILWLGWYGFNGAAATTSDGLASIFTTTTLAAALASCSTMIFTWVKNGKPDVSMTLNGSLAGLVAITAGCDTVDALGASIIGIIAGILVVMVVEFLDLKLHVDDPVGAVGVHFANGIFGTLAVGLFSCNPDSLGLFYGGGFHYLGVQALGVVAILTWTGVMITLLFLLIKKTVGLRVTPEEEITGLDLEEHGLASAYADFMPSPVSGTVLTGGTAAETIASAPAAVMDEAIPVMVKTESKPRASDVKMTKLVIVTKQSKFEVLKTAMEEIGITGMTVTQVLGCGMQKGRPEYYRGVAVEMNLLPKIEVEVVVCKVPVRTVLETAKKVLYTGHIGDGKIFVYDVENVVKVRTGEEGYAALQDVE